ncbi:hypothetical protein NUACC21_48310 [Scytonema sp. NUACC21]
MTRKDNKVREKSVDASNRQYSRLQQGKVQIVVKVRLPTTLTPFSERSILMWGFPPYILYPQLTPDCFLKDNKENLKKFIDLTAEKLWERGVAEVTTQYRLFSNFIIFSCKSLDAVAN